MNKFSEWLLSWTDYPFERKNKAEKNRLVKEMDRLTAELWGAEDQIERLKAELDRLNTRLFKANDAIVECKRNSDQVINVQQKELAEHQQAIDWMNEEIESRGQQIERLKAELEDARREAAGPRQVKYLRGWGTAIETNPGKWLIFVSSESSLPDAVEQIKQIDRQIVGLNSIGPGPFNDVAVCPATHFEGVKPLGWESCNRGTQGAL